ncbi:FGGY-family carbohydrate kinase [Blautia schinkii]|nr:FGGY-family carbohydrate kinase [Blautia schinkii]
MGKKIIAWDLGTGGNKASLYDENGNCVASNFTSYDTFYPAHGWHEQRPVDWWKAVVQSTKKLLKTSGVNTEEIVACGISGHSLGAVPIGKNGELLREYTPIWSDGRAVEEAQHFFEKYDEDTWYTLTGNGFTAAFYTAFKIMWYRNHEPEMYSKIRKVIGTKDYINFKLTGRLCTDPSYASGCGVWDLVKWDYSDELMNAMDLPRNIFPEVIKSTDIVGVILPEAAHMLGLPEHVKVVAGGVDNSCMALGAKAFKEGRVYNSLGSSSWIAVSSKKPLLESKIRPYVFAHVVPEYYASALCVTAGGTAFRWYRDQLGHEFSAAARETGADEYDYMTNEASKSPIGAKRLIFNPSLGGGMPMNKSYNLRGGYVGLDLIHTRADVIRATMEGITMGLRSCLDEIRNMTEIGDEMLLVGGGSKSALWRQIYADIYNMNVVKSNIDQQAAALGAAACAAVGTGIWDDFEQIDELHQVEEYVKPIQENVEFYNREMEIYNKVTDMFCDIGDMLMTL